MLHLGLEKAALSRKPGNRESKVNASYIFDRLSKNREEEEEEENTITFRLKCIVIA